MAQFSETHLLESAPSIDEDLGVIRGVKLLGFESANGRKYSKHAVAEARSLYEDAKSYINHPQRSQLSEDRNWRDWAGNVRSVRLESDGLYGDLHLRQAGGDYDGLVEAARKFHKQFGLSHVVEGDSRTLDDGSEMVESITGVHSVDIVTDPATTSGLYESRAPKMASTVKRKLTKVAELAESGSSQRKLLMEMVERDGDLSVEIDPEAKPAEQIKAAMSEAIAKLLESDAEAVERLFENMDGEPKDPKKRKKKTDDSDDSDNGKMESRLCELEEKLRVSESKGMLLESRIEATPVRIKALAAAEESDRKDLLESWPKSESLSLDGRPESSPPRFSESEDKAEEDDYAERWEESVKRAEKILESRGA